MPAPASFAIWPPQSRSARALDYLRGGARLVVTKSPAWHAREVHDRRHQRHRVDVAKRLPRETSGVTTAPDLDHRSIIAEPRAGAANVRGVDEYLPKIGKSVYNSVFFGILGQLAMPVSPISSDNLQFNRPQ